MDGWKSVSQFSRRRERATCEHVAFAVSLSCSVGLLNLNLERNSSYINSSFVLALCWSRFVRHGQQSDVQ